MASNSRQFTPGGLPRNCETHCVSGNRTHNLPIVSPTRYQLCHRDHNLWEIQRCTIECHQRTAGAVKWKSLPYFLPLMLLIMWFRVTNCRQGSRFNDVFHKFLHDEQLTCVDMLRLNGIFTYLCDDGQRMSWIDHIVCSPTLLPYVTDIGVLQDKLCSDHMPLYASFQ